MYALIFLLAFFSVRMKQVQEVYLKPYVNKKHSGPANSCQGNPFVNLLLVSGNAVVYWFHLYSVGISIILDSFMHSTKLCVFDLEDVVCL